jgi:protein SHQ1
MITPVFRLSQEDAHVIIVIRVPYVKISSSEVFVELSNFRFYLKPYYLNLTFKQELQQEEPESAIYDHNTYEITFRCKKMVTEEFFDDLDMITSLMKPKMEKKKTNYKPKIEVLDSFEDSQLKDTEIPSEKDVTFTGQAHLLGNFRCGFNLSFDCFFKNLEEESYEISDINPDTTDLSNRIQIMILYENQMFSPEHYLQDFMEPENALSLTKSEFLLPTKIPYKDLSKSDLQKLTLKDL